VRGFTWIATVTRIERGLTPDENAPRLTVHFQVGDVLALRADPATAASRMLARGPFVASMSPVSRPCAVASACRSGRGHGTSSALGGSSRQPARVPRRLTVSAPNPASRGASTEIEFPWSISANRFPSQHHFLPCGRWQGRWPWSHLAPSCRPPIKRRRPRLVPSTERTRALASWRVSSYWQRCWDSAFVHGRETPCARGEPIGIGPQGNPSPAPVSVIGVLVDDQSGEVLAGPGNWATCGPVARHGLSSHLAVLTGRSTR
jgi:hypothetical protein